MKENSKQYPLITNLLPGNAKYYKTTIVSQ